MRLRFVFAMAALLSLVACAAKGTGTGTGTSATPAVPTPSSPAPTPTAGALLTSSEHLQEQGQLIPLKAVDLSINSDGLVSQVLASDGQAVQAGQLLVKLGGYEQAASTVAAAKRDVLTSQQALDKLKRDANIAVAIAHLTYVTTTLTVSNSQRALTNLLNPITSGAAQSLADAQLAASTDAANLQLINQGTLGQAVQSAQTALDIAAYAYNQAVIGCQTGPCNSDRKDQLYTVYQNAQTQLAATQLALQTAAATSADKVNKANQAVQVAQANLAALNSKPDPAKLAFAQANLDVAKAAQADAEARWKTLQTGPDPVQLAADQANLDNAQAALAAAQASLANLELHAPFAGTLANFNVQVGEYLAKGKVVGSLADLSGWLVQIDSVTQFDLPSISLGQAVQVTFDGLPDLTLPGHVSFISPYFINQDPQNKLKTTFSVQIKLDKLAPRLQWGMTANVAY